MLTVQRTLLYPGKNPEIMRPRDLRFMVALNLITTDHAQRHVSHERDGNRLIVQLKGTPGIAPETATFEGTPNDITTLVRALRAAIKAKQS